MIFLNSSKHGQSQVDSAELVHTEVLLRHFCFHLQELQPTGSIKKDHHMIVN